jgi:pimeloyl-ACP methyl ester carboxylesterase
MPIDRKPQAFRSADGLRLAADGFGDPSGRPVLLLHGGGQTRHAWSATGESLAAAGFYAVSLDLRGHGESQWCPRGDYRHTAFAADTEAVASTFARPPVLVGASLGGLSSLFALDAARVAGRSAPAAALVLVDIATRMQLDGAQRILAFMSAHPTGVADLDEAADAVAAYNPNRPRPKDTSGLEKNLRRDDDGRYRWRWDPAFVEGRLTPAAMSELDSLDRAARDLDIPALLVRGQLSDLLSEEDARHFLDQVPHAKFVDVSNAGHMVAGDRNDQFRRAVIDFLVEHVPADAA